MSNRLYRSQFMYSFFKQPVVLAGYADLVAPTKAFLVNQGVTLTAVQYGVGGESITYAITGGAVAGAEVVTVVGNAISIQIESGVSSITDVQAALAGSVPASALVVATGAGAAVVNAPLAATPLAGSVEGVSSFYAPGVENVYQTALGEFTLSLQDKYPRLINASYELQAAVAIDLVPQQSSEDVSVSKDIVMAVLSAGVKTEIAAATRVYFSYLFNNSSLN